MIKNKLHHIKRGITLRNTVILLTIIFIIIQFVKTIQKYNYVMKNEPLLIKKSMIIQPHIIPNKKLKKARDGRLTYTYSFWIFMKHVSGEENWHINYYDDRNILRKGSNPVFYYNPENNVYKIGILTQLDDEIIETFEIKDILFQKWNHFVISLDNRNVDVFVNGYLHSSYLLKNVPILNDSSLIVGSMQTKVNGLIDNMRYFNRNLTKSEVSRLYKIGHSVTNTWWLYP